MVRHWRRLWASIIGTYDRAQPLSPKGRRSLYRGYWFELGHSIKNVPVEYLRHWGIWDRGGKNG
jgi:hypothetical protein